MILYSPKACKLILMGYLTPLKELEQFLVHLDTVMEDKEKEQQSTSVNANIAVDGVQTRNLLPLNLDMKIKI